MAEIIRTLRAPVRASASPVPQSVPVLHTLAFSALTAARTELSAPEVGVKRLERALAKAIRASSLLKQAIRTAQEGGAA